MLTVGKPPALGGPGAGDYNEHISRVFTVDVIALACLIVGIAAFTFAQRGS